MRTPQCKHETCKTNHCPHCGERLILDGERGELTHYCRTQAAIAERNLASAVTGSTTPPTEGRWDHRKSDAERIPRLREHVERWKRWAKWLGDLA